MKKQLEVKPLILPLPAVLVGSWSGDRTPNAMTASWVSPCSATPPCVGVAVRPSRKTYANIMENRCFTVNVPGAGLVKEVDYLGITSGKTVPDKLSRTGIQVVDGAEVDAPLLVQCPLNLECLLRDTLAVGTHVWMVGEIVAVHADEAFIDGEGHLRDGDIDPLGYMSGSKRYSKGAVLADKAFDVGKQIKNS